MEKKKNNAIEKVEIITTTGGVDADAEANVDAVAQEIKKDKRGLKRTKTAKNVSESQAVMLAKRERARVLKAEQREAQRRKEERSRELLKAEKNFCVGILH